MCLWEKYFLLLTELSSQCWWFQQGTSNRSKCSWSTEGIRGSNPTASPWQQCWSWQSANAREENNHTRGGIPVHFFKVNTTEPHIRRDNIKTLFSHLESVSLGGWCCIFHIMLRTYWRIFVNNKAWTAHKHIQNCSRKGNSAFRWH